MTIATFMDEQPRAAVDGFDEAGRRFRAMELSGRERLTLVGSGSSLNACMVAAAFMGDARVAPPVDFLARPPRKAVADELVVVLTQSGASTTSIAAASRARDEGARVVVVTANAESPAAGLGLPVVAMPIGEEPIGPKTKGYAASCAVLFALAASRGADIAPPDAQALDGALQAARRRARTLAGELDGLDYLLVCGAGAGHGTALEGSLKVAEIAGLPTAAFSIEETLHGRLHGATANSLVMPIVHDAETRAQAGRIEAAMAAHGVRVEAVPAGDLTQPWGVLASTFPFQALAVELALRRGREPELMRYPGLTRRLAIKTETAT